jgi:hypothetical protein
MDRSSAIDWAADLTESARAARIVRWALDQGRGEELARWDCLYEDSPNPADPGIASGTEPSAD